MAPFLEVFLSFGGFWIAILLALTWIAFARLSSIPDEAARWSEALSTPWLMKTAVGLSLLAWVWNFGRLFLGEAYLRGAGAFAELSTLLLAVILILAGAAWLSISRPRFRPWATHGLVLAVILSSGPLLRPMPEEVLSQGAANDRRGVAFVQGRLAHLGCFEAADEQARRDGTFEALTASAVIAFQAANGLTEPDLHTPGEIRPSEELRLLAHPFPFVFGPEPCP